MTDRQKRNHLCEYPDAYVNHGQGCGVCKECRPNGSAEDHAKELRDGLHLALWWINNDRRAPHRRLVVQRLEALLGEESYD